MFILPGLISLLVAHYLKVHEIVPVLSVVPVVIGSYALACFGLLIDFRMGIGHPEASPCLPLALLLCFWTILSVGINSGQMGHHSYLLFVYLMLFLLIAHGVQSFRALRMLVISIFAISIFLGVVAFIQARSPFQCNLLSVNQASDVIGRPDGRSCETNADCRAGAEPGEIYACERPGPMETMSIGHGRVRYRGILEDPNELALVLVISLPFAMTLLAQRVSAMRVVIVAATFAIFVPVVIWTGSRTGQLAFVAVVAAYLLRKIRLKTVLVVSLLALPLLLLGGRSGEEADASATDRLEAWSAGLEFVRASPLWGIGKGQFVENFVITAHNTYLLEAAELGLIGMILWLGIFYTGFKIVISALRRYRDRADATVAYAWARALLASLCGIAAGTMFLSLGYHPVIWTYLALPSAFYLAARRHDPDFRVVFGARDLSFVSGFAILFLIGTKIYLKIRGI
jgi:O-antigen ligase